MATTFTFSPEEFEAVVQGWQDLQTQITAAQGQFSGFIQLAMQPPADDDVTLTFLWEARDALFNAETSNRAIEDYVKGILDNLQACKQDYVNADNLTMTID